MLIPGGRGFDAPQALRSLTASEAAKRAMGEDDQQTQKTQPKTDAEPADIPIPTRERVFGDLEKVAPKVEPGQEPDDD